MYIYIYAYICVYIVQSLESYWAVVQEFNLSDIIPCNGGSNGKDNGQWNGHWGNMEGLTKPSLSYCIGETLLLLCTHYGNLVSVP